VDTGDAYKREIGMLRRRFAGKLRSRREDRFHSQEAFAESARLHRTTIGGLERGKTDPRLSTLLIVADALEMSLADLVGDLAVPKQRKPPPPAAGERGSRSRSRRKS
jgi:DNA-binding XRE family transcriptional regulator